MASTGNVGLWVMRLSLLVGKFDYAPKGILDETHVKLYTRRSFRRLLRDSGFEVTKEDRTVIPLEELVESLPGPIGRATMAIEAAQYLLSQRWPGLFAYQFILEAEPS